MNNTDINSSKKFKAGKCKTVTLLLRTDVFDNCGDNFKGLHEISLQSFLKKKCLYDEVTGELDISKNIDFKSLHKHPKLTM